VNVIPLPAVLENTSLSRPTSYRLIKKGHFPAPRKVGKKSEWEEDAIDRWLMDLPSGVLGVPQFLKNR
jgi:predicted DNA-binding transcriptional regulator AlpA